MTHLEYLRELRAMARPRLKKLRGVEDDLLAEQLRRRRALARSGRLRWGYILMANMRAWEGRASAPGSVLYSPDPWFERYPHALGSIGGRVFEMYGSELVPDPPALRYLYDRVESGALRNFGMRLPAEITGGRVVYQSTTWIRLRDLPGKQLRGTVVPTWVDEEGYLMILPGSLWPAAFREEWLENDEPPSKPPE